MITVAVVRRGALDVQVDRRVAADLRVRAGNRVHGGPHPVDGVVRGLAVRRAWSACPAGRRARPADDRRGDRR